MGAYHFTLYLQVKRKSYLYMGLVCLAIFVRALLVDDGSQVLYEMIPDLSNNWGRTIEYCASYATLFLTPMFIHSIFYRERYRKYVDFFIYVGLVLLGIVLFTPYAFFRHTLNIFHFLSMLSFILVFAMLFRALRKRLMGSKPIFWGIAICFVFVFIEMLKNAEVVDFHFPGPNLIGTGVLIFLFFQSVALSSIFAKSFLENRQLTKDLEERVSQRTELLSKSNVIKGNLIKIMSHDLRSPLTVLKDLLSIQKAGALSEQETKDLFQTVSTRVDSTLEMLDDLLAWASSQVNSNDFKIYKEELYLKEHIDLVVDLLSAHSNPKSIKILNHVDNTITAWSDKNVLNLVLRNLIMNAIKFTPTSGEIEVSSDANEDFLILKVSDNGIGIPEEIKPHLFQVEKSNQRLGTQNEKSVGLGLALCKDLVVQNGGEIWVLDNLKGPGSVFCVSFRSQPNLVTKK